LSSFIFFFNSFASALSSSETLFFLPAALSLPSSGWASLWARASLVAVLAGRPAEIGAVYPAIFLLQGFQFRLFMPPGADLGEELAERLVRRPLFGPGRHAHFQYCLLPRAHFFGVGDVEAGFPVAAVRLHLVARLQARLEIFPHGGQVVLAEAGQFPGARRRDAARVERHRVRRQYFIAAVGA